MDAQTQSRARLTMHAIKQHSRLLADSLDASAVDLSPECTRWSAVSDPRRWLAPSLASGDHARGARRAAVLDLAARYADAAHDLERFIREGAAGHDCDAKAALRDDCLALADELIASLADWIADDDRAAIAPKREPALFPQYVPRAVPKPASTPELSPISRGGAS